MSEERFEVSPCQEHLWGIEPEGPSGRIQAIVRLVGRLDEHALESALARAAARHEILRTTFVREPGIRVPLQVVHDSLAPSVRALELAGLAADERGAAIERARREELSAPVDLAGGPVLRAILASESEREHTLLVTLSELHADEASVPALLDEIVHALTGGGPLVEDPLQYADFAAWQRELASSAEDGGAQSREHWSARRGLRSPSLPFAEGGDGSAAVEEVAVTLAPESIDAVASQSQEIANFVQAAWQVLLARVSGAETVAVGVAGPLAPNPELEGAIGRFGWVLPFTADISPDTPFSAVRDRVVHDRELALRHEAYASGDLGTGLTAGFAAHPGYRRDTEHLRVTLERVVTSSPQFAISLVCQLTDPRPELRIVFDPRRLPADSVRDLADTLGRLVSAFATDPELPVGEPDVLSTAERERILRDFNDTRAAIPETTVHELISEQAAAHPERTATVDERETITYGELDRRANQLAHRLRDAGVRRGAAVGLCAERTVEAVVALLGIMKAGGAYVPLNPEHPSARLAAQLEAAGARAIVAEELLMDALPDFTGEMISLDRDRHQLDAQPDTAVAIDSGPDDLAYVIYTSGSTGTPKGVGVTHRNLAGYATDIARRVGADAEPLTFGLVTALSTDLGNTSVFGALCSGGTLAVISAPTAADPQLLAAQLRSTPLDVLKITPSHIGALLAAGTPDVLPRRWLILGGERLPWDIVERVRALSSVAIINHYGPTEATVGCCAMDVAGAPGPYRPASVPIGRPLSNVACYILDDRMRPVGIGLAGRLFVGGAGVARGYVGQPELTAERFLPDPFAALSLADGARMYDTGDLARWLPDGTIEFLGRVDDQVKLRGYRVEPGEIESALRRHAQVREAAVVTHTGASGELQLVAYCTTAAPVSAEELRAHLQALLPEIMIPSAIGVLDQLPRTASGKVDRLRLPDPATLTPSQQAAYVEPQTPVQEAVAAVWAETLGLERVGATDDFFELGGHSLLATQVVAQLRSDLAVDLPLHVLFLSPTVQELAAEIERLLEADESSDTEVVSDLAATGDS